MCACRSLGKPRCNLHTHTTYTRTQPTRAHNLHAHTKVHSQKYTVGLLESLVAWGGFALFKVKAVNEVDADRATLTFQTRSADKKWQEEEEEEPGGGGGDVSCSQRQLHATLTRATRVTAEGIE
jgi:hypothetical protein